MIRVNGLLLLAGGAWNNGVQAGCRTANLNNFPWNVNANIGVRLACDLIKSIRHCTSWCTSKTIIILVRTVNPSCKGKHTKESYWLVAKAKGGSFIKRIGNIYSKIYDFENICIAHKKACKCKRYNDEVLEFGSKLEENIINIQNHLMWKSYECGEYRKFKVYEPKERLVMALPFKDRVVQHALNNIIEPIFDKSFIYHSYACRRGKGVHQASQQLTEWLYNMNLSHGENIYFIKADISKYFINIDHEILKKIIRKKIKCEDTLHLIETIINHNGTEGELKGIPVGNLTSQLFANVYLNELDKFVKETLKIKYYMRYMDDFLIFSSNKEELREILALTTGFLQTNLKLTLNPKTGIFKAKNGVDFVGYRHWYTHKKMRKANLKRIRNKIKKYNKMYSNGEIDFEKVNRSVQSWLGHIKHANTYNIRKKILASIVLKRKE